MKLLLFLGVVLSGSIYGQEFQEDYQKVQSRYGYEVYRPGVVGFNYFIDFEEDSLDLIFYLAVSIQNDFLQFKLADGTFISKFHVSFLIRNEEQQTILSQSWQEDYTSDNFEKTNSLRDFFQKTYQINIKDFVNQLHDGYEVLLEITDMQSSIRYQNKRKLNMDLLHKSYTDIVFLRVPENGNDFNLSDMDNHVDFNVPYMAYANLKQPLNESDTVKVNVRLFKIENEERNLKDQLFIEENNPAKTFKIEYPLPFEKMEEGKYLLRFSINMQEKSFEIEKEFSVLWLSKPLYLYKIDLAVRPMKYLLNEDDMESVKQYDLTELEKWFHSYWKNIDPTQETTYNEIQHVFYRRVSEAVRDYSTRFKEGWQTDLGMVWILYGEPTQIENRKYSVNNTPHIIWKYDFEDNKYEFTFVDKENNGNFILVEPESEQNN
jgi:GWxTD domain-containing protein